MTAIHGAAHILALPVCNAEDIAMTRYLFAHRPRLAADPGQ